VAALRSELAAIEPARACCRAAELAALGNGRRARTARPVARLAMRLEAGRSSPAGFEWQRAAEHCRRAWLRGRFLACGSLSLAGGRSHLEFVLAPADVDVLGARLAGMGLPASVRLRRGRGVVTWKSAETIVTFLRLVGASVAALELEARFVTRSLRGALNRAINAESANLRRQVAASTRQLEALAVLESDGRLTGVATLERIVAAGRREAPEATFTELAARLGMTRSQVQRSLSRLEALALHGGSRAPR
jgi:DNA-binding protein WhiA